MSRAGSLQRPPTANAGMGATAGTGFGLQDDNRLFSSPAPPMNADIPDMKQNRPHTGGNRKPPTNRGVSQPHAKTQRH